MSDTEQKVQEDGTGIAEQISAMQASVEALAGQFTAAIEAAQAANTAQAETLANLTQRLETMEGATAMAVQEAEREREELIAVLVEKAPDFTQEELAAQSTTWLRKLQSSLGVPASGRGGPRSDHSKVEDAQQFAEPVPYWLVDSPEQQASA